MSAEQRTLEGESEALPVTIHFKAGIGMQGAITRMRLVQLDNEITLTAEQCRSLAAQIDARLGIEKP